MTFDVIPQVAAAGGNIGARVEAFRERTTLAAQVDGPRESGQHDGIEVRKQTP